MEKCCDRRRIGFSGRPVGRYRCRQTDDLLTTPLSNGLEDQNPEIPAIANVEKDVQSGRNREEMGGVHVGEEDRTKKTARELDRL